MPSPRLDQLIGSLRPHPDEVRMHRILNDDRDERRHDDANAVMAQADVPEADRIIGKLRTLRREIEDASAGSNGYLSDEYAALIDSLSDATGMFAQAVNRIAEDR